MTPFGRQPMTAGLIATHQLSEAAAVSDAPDKWAVLRQLTVARKLFGVSDRDLAVLAALLSFHPSPALSDDSALIVFPSNASLSGRVHGMAESTLRRHLAALVKAGFLLRRDSPNGKRYATRDINGHFDRVYGFDLRPLLLRAGEISAAAQKTAAENHVNRRHRETIVILLRNTEKLIAWGRDGVEANWELVSDALALCQRKLRRKLEPAQMRDLVEDASDLLAHVKHLVTVETSKPSGNDIQNERHYQSSDSELKESESCSEETGAAAEPDPHIPLETVLTAAPDLLDFAPDGIRDWREYIETASFVSPMLGISPDAWRRAIDAMGAVNAAITLACILQRHDSISRPGGYLRCLTRKASENDFSPAPMTRALLRRTDRNRLAASRAA